MANSNNLFTLGLNIGATKKNIKQQLKQIAQELSAQGVFKITATLNEKKTLSTINRQLKGLSKELKVDVSVNPIVKGKKAIKKDIENSLKGIDTKQDYSLKANTFSNEVVAWWKKNANGASAYDAQLRQIILDTQKVTSKSDLTKLRDQFKNIKSQVAATSQTSQGFFGKLKTDIKSALVDMFRYQLAYKIIQLATQSLKSMVNQVIELNTALTELSVVSNTSVDNLKGIADSAYEIAQKIGSSTTEVIKSVTEWRRLGNTIEDSLMLAEQASALSTGGFMNLDTATEALTSTLQAFDEIDISNVSDAVDSFIYVGNNYAITSEKLATSLEKSSAALVSAGNSFNQVQAMEVAGNTILQDADSVSNALKVVSMRLRGTSAKALIEEAEDTEGLIEDASKLYTTIKELTKVQSNPEGVSIIDEQTGAYLSTYEILLQISKVFDEIEDGKKASLLEAIAGKQRASAVAAILSNGDILESVYGDLESGKQVGAGTKALEMSMESIEKKTAQFKNQWQKLASEVIESDWIKNLVDAGTKLLETITNLLKDNDLVSSSITGITSLLKGLTNILNELSKNKGLSTLFKSFMTLKTLQMGQNFFSFLGAKGQQQRNMEAFFQSAVNGTLSIKDGIVQIGQAEKQLINNSSGGKVTKRQNGVLLCPVFFREYRPAI